MDNNYLDFGQSSSDSDDDDGGMMGMNCTAAMDSDEEEQYENEQLLKVLSLPTATKKTRDIDEFEAEMEAELDQRALEAEKEGGMEHQRSLSRSSSSSSLNKNNVPDSFPSVSKSALSSSKAKTQPKKSVQFADEEPPPPGTSDSLGDSKSKETYDSIYFDSDESEGEDDQEKEKKKKKREVFSNDDLFYDPESDAKDQAWVDNKRRKYCRSIKDKKTKSENSNSEQASGSGSKSKTKQEAALPSTDAVLNCPACFTVLCLDCQRHEFYAGQYRAMFVMNCVVDKAETLVVPLKEPKKKSKRDKGKVQTEEVPRNSESDKFFPVKCKICTTHIAVYDHDEVYHFFNVLASHP